TPLRTQWSFSGGASSLTEPSGTTAHAHPTAAPRATAHAASAAEPVIAAAAPANTITTAPGPATRRAASAHALRPPATDRAAICTATDVPASAEPNRTAPMIAAAATAVLPARRR